MKKRYISVIGIVFMLILVGCSHNTSTTTSKNQEIQKELIKVHGDLYYSTEKESEMTVRCGTMDGTITSYVDENKIPQVDDQSNFGKDYGYQIGQNENEIEVNKDGHWIVFEKCQNQEDLE